MKLLALIFLSGLALVNPDPVPKEKNLGEKLQEQYKEILEKMKENLENGKKIKNDTIEKLKEIRQKLKDLNIDLSKQAKELLEKLKDKIKDIRLKSCDKCCRILEIMMDRTKKPSFSDDGEAKYLRKSFEDLLEEFVDGFIYRHITDANIRNEMKDVYDIMKKRSIALSLKSRGLIQYLKDRAPHMVGDMFDYFDVNFNDDEEDHQKIFEDLLKKLDDS